MASKTWQKTFKWTVHYQEECLWSIFTSSIYCFQYRPECRLPYLVVGCRSCPCNLLRANMNNTQLRYRVRIIWNGVNINTVLQNLFKLDRIEKANCIFEWDPANLQPGQSILIASTSQIKIHKQKESYLQFHIFIFFLSIPPSILLFWAVLSPLKHSAWLPPCECLHLRPPSSGFRLSLFSEVRYWICFQCDVYKLIESAHARDARMVIPWTSKLQLPLLNSKSWNRLSPFKWKPPNMIRNLCCNTNHTKNYLT